MATEERKFEVGQEVLLSGPQGHEGVIKFVGEVEFAEGIMYGVELAPEFAGKNDGSVDGKQYFESEANRGVFVPIDRIRRTVSNKDRTSARRLDRQDSRRQRVRTGSLQNQDDFLQDKPMAMRSSTDMSDEPAARKEGPREIGRITDWVGGDDEYKGSAALEALSNGSFLEEKSSYTPQKDQEPVPRKAGPRDIPTSATESAPVDSTEAMEPVPEAATEPPADEVPAQAPAQAPPQASATEEKMSELEEDNLPPPGPAAEIDDDAYNKYVKLAIALSPEQWEGVLGQIDLLERRRICAALKKNQKLAEGAQDLPRENWEEALQFLLKKMEKVHVAVKSQGKRLTKLEARTANSEPRQIVIESESDSSSSEDEPEPEPEEKEPEEAPKTPSEGGRGRGKARGGKTRGGKPARGGKAAGGRGRGRGAKPARGGAKARGGKAAPAKGGRGKAGGRTSKSPGRGRGDASRGGKAARGGRGAKPARGGSKAARGGKGGGRGRGRGKAPAQTATEAPEEKESMPVTELDPQRRRNYKFGTRNINLLLPSEGYPARKDARGPVEGSLTLTHVHGYRGNKGDSRQNLYVSNDGNFLIYYIAAVGVVKNLAENTQQFFTLHNDDITTICLDPREGSTLVATGQKDPKDIPGEGKDLPKIWIWDYASMRKVKLINNVCERSIRRLQWSPVTGFLYVVCGDEDQTLKIYDSEQFNVRGPIEPIYSDAFTKEEVFGFVISPQPNAEAGYIDELAVYTKRKIFHTGVKRNNDTIELRTRGTPIGSLNKNGEKAFTCAAFVGGTRYVVGGASGNMYLCDEARALAMQKVAGKAVGDCIWTGDEIILAAMDKSVRRLTITGNDRNPFEEVAAATDISIAGSDFVMTPRCISLAPSGSLFVGTKSNQVMEFGLDTQAARIVVDGHDGQVWGLACHPRELVYVTAGWDRALKLWSSETRQCIGTYEFEADSKEDPWQLVQASWSPQGDIIAVGSTDSRVAILSFPSLELLTVTVIPPKTANAEVESVSYLRFSPDGNRLGVAHMDSQAYIFDVIRNGGGVELQQWRPLPHTGGAPTHLQFSSDGQMVKTFTRDYEVVHWNLKSNRRVGVFNPNIADPDVVTWADDPLIAGWDVEGLYQAGWDGTDLNDAALTSDKELIASGDDYGIVRLHNYPAVFPEACRQYTGHAEFVVGVEWLCDDSYLMTCGGADMAIFQWELNRE